VAGASVTAVVRGREATTTRTGDNGRYELRTVSGAQLVAGDGEHIGYGGVARAAVGEEIVDLVVGEKR
jgi:hypothetical protein